MRKAKSVTHGHVHKAKDLELTYSKVRFDGYRLCYHDAGRNSKKRADSLLTKEPTTIMWMDSFTKDDIFVDIGANVGMYSTYAGKVVGCRVFSFEPESLNYAELNKNIYLNGLHGNVRAFPCAMSDRVRLDALYLSAFIPAYSHHDCGENRWEGPVTGIAESHEGRLPQGCMAITLDAAVGDFGIPQPTHIKVDVDGLEHLVVEGAWDTISNPALKTILLETDFRLDTGLPLMKRMTDAGWKFSMDQACVSKHGRVTPELWNHRATNGIGGSNVIWFRDDKYFDYFKRATAEIK